MPRTRGFRPVDLLEWTLLAVMLAVPVAPAWSAPEAVRSPALADLAWIAGHWMRVADGTRMEEGWFGPAGGMMLGLHRDVPSTGKAGFEFLRIAETPEGIVYYASPGGRPATPFPLKEAAGQHAVFENAEHDFPQRIIYWREETVLHARVEGILDGKAAAEEWAWDLQP